MNPLPAFAIPCRLLCSEYFANSFGNYSLFPALLGFFVMFKVEEGKNLQ